MNTFLKYGALILAFSNPSAFAKEDWSDLAKRFRFVDTKVDEPAELNTLQAVSTQVPNIYLRKGMLYCRHLKKIEKDGSQFTCQITDEKDHPLNISGEKISEKEAKDSGARLKVRVPVSTKQRVFNKSLYSEILASHLMWAMGFPTDKVFVADQLVCKNCSNDEDDSEPASHFRHASVTISYDAQNLLKDANWEFKKLNRFRRSSTWSMQQKTEFDALALMLSFLSPTQSRDLEHKVVCKKTKSKECLAPLAYIGSAQSFFSGTVEDEQLSSDLQAWLSTPIWNKSETCELSLPIGRKGKSRLEISEEGRVLFLNRMKTLIAHPDSGDQTLRLLLRKSKVIKIDTAINERLPHLNEDQVLNLWAAAFKAKMSTVEAITCGSIKGL